MRESAADHTFRLHLEDRLPSRPTEKFHRDGDVVMPCSLWQRISAVLLNNPNRRIKVFTGPMGDQELVVDKKHWPIDAEKYGISSLTIPVMIGDTIGPEGDDVATEAKEYMGMEMAASLFQSVISFLEQKLKNPRNVVAMFFYGLDFPLSEEMFLKLIYPQIDNVPEYQKQAIRGRYKWVNKHVCQKLECLVSPALIYLLSQWSIAAKNEAGLMEIINPQDFSIHVSADPYNFSREQSLSITLRKEGDICSAIRSASDIMVLPKDTKVVRNRTRERIHRATSTRAQMH